jgi:hypothetical protein
MEGATMDTMRITISQQSAGGDVESHEDAFIRQVDDRTLPALQVLAEQQLGLADEIPGPLFIP